MPCAAGSLSAKLTVDSGGGLKALLRDCPHKPLIECEVHTRFFAEGAANALFSLHFHDLPPHIGFRDEFPRGVLLRLRKSMPCSPEAGITAPPPYVSAEETHHFINDIVAPQIGSVFVGRQALVTVSSGFIIHCNELLQDLEVNDRRNPKRCGWIINPDHRTALLIENMYPPDEGSMTVEFKPKWLKHYYSSPDVKRCRTCAWHVKSGRDIHKRYCPVALLMGTEQDVSHQIANLIPSADEIPIGWSKDALIKELAKFITSDDRQNGMRFLLQRLNALQADWDKAGVLQVVPITGENYSSKVTPELLKLARDAFHKEENYEPLKSLARAMTLRDCTVYIHLEANSDKFDFRVRVFDLDIKRPDDCRLLKWALDEFGLRKNGYYTATDATQPRTEEICRLRNRSP